MAAETSTYVADRIGGKGNVVMFVFDAFPPVQVRWRRRRRVFGNHPDIKILDKVTPDVSTAASPSRAKMEPSSPHNPTPGSISAVWAGGTSRPRRPSGDCRRWP